LRTECRLCGSKNVEPINVVHQCEHVKVVEILCLDCGMTDLELLYPKERILEW